eukprot:scaffold20312_cov185-Amphora_coffeaeformis.AAC.6
MPRAHPHRTGQSKTSAWHDTAGTFAGSLLYPLAWLRPEPASGDYPKGAVNATYVDSCSLDLKWTGA